MVYVKRIELSHFKSFGGTTQVPFLPGFTVISGPNGSGKSNILDALLFALGLSTSKGMRAERLPDLVNQSYSSRRSRATSEASVTVTLALSDNPELGEGVEWQVTRRLRVTGQGTYTSTYFVNGEVSTLTELHEQLREIRIYPEGYNVVLQGDVTGIISMNPRERRQIIDELAGVAAFDRKINQAKEKLEAVKEHEERFQIVERELIIQRDRLAQDRVKAEKYQKLRTRLQEESQWEGVLLWQHQQQQVNQLKSQLAAGEQVIRELGDRLTSSATIIKEDQAQLDSLNAQVKALGEDELLGLQSQLSTQEAEQRQWQRHQQELDRNRQDLATQLQQTRAEIQDYQQTLTNQAQNQQHLQRQLLSLEGEQDQAQAALTEARGQANALVAAAETWVQEQTKLHRDIETLGQTLEPQRAEQIQIQERLNLWEQQREMQTQTLEDIAAEITAKTAQWRTVETQHRATQDQADVLTQAVAIADQELQLQRQTQTRLLGEQREQQRQLDKLEAQVQAIQESQGTAASQLLLKTGLPGVRGLVAQLGQVAVGHQLALEMAAGARLGNLVVEDDGVAAAAIQLLKAKKAGRATFLPLNKIRVPHRNPIPHRQRPAGFLDYAVNLIDCEPAYATVFAYVFGNTVVFEDLDQARLHLGQYRIVTLAGELLETSGAMTGGSTTQRPGGLHFGLGTPQDSEAIIALKTRLQEVDQILDRCNQAIQRASDQVRQRSQALGTAQKQQRDDHLQAQQLQGILTQLRQQEVQLQSQLEQQAEAQVRDEERLAMLLATLPDEEQRLQTLRQTLGELEQSQTYSDWQQMQAAVQAREAILSDRQVAVRATEQQLEQLAHQQQRLQEKIHQGEKQLAELRQRQTNGINQHSQLVAQFNRLETAIGETKAQLAVLEQHLGTAKQARDRSERQLRERRTQHQQLAWERQKLEETQAERHRALAANQAQLQTQAADLPNPLPDIPPDWGLEQLQQNLRSLQKRIQAMEPVNMLALESYEQTQARLEELSQKSATLGEERMELLLRIENFTTLRQQAFQEAFGTVNQNFQQIFAELSDGDGHLQLDMPQDPLSGGLNLIAHPKGKPVRRLASMSGGEKSLTALSFIFALQRYRPSPFYAFDEVDMFLDGANVERLARMIRQQAQQAQFIVVSLRRPMIESAERAVGVTQGRGAYTQVLGINLQAQQASS